MMCELKTKSQMILRIAELSEENSLLKDTIEELKKESKTVTECFFKRSDYARDLEKEKEQLKKEIGILENLVKVFESSKDDSDKLVKECERLKKLYESAKSMNGCCAHRIAELEEQNGGMQILINNYMSSLNKYITDFQEIRDIVKTEINKTDDEDELQEIYRKIENKISEAIGVE